MKITLAMAMSVNGMIAMSDFSEEFLDGTWEQWLKIIKSYDCLIWGRTTYELVNKMEKKYIDSVSSFKKLVLSTNLNTKVNSGDLVFDSPENLIKNATKFGYKHLLLSGGSKTNSEFAKRNLIDKIVLIVDSNVVGNGIPLFFTENFFLKLNLVDVSKLNSHLFLVNYIVVK